MSILSFDKPAKARDFKTHAKMYSSSADIAGTYVPNMSRADMEKWKAKHVKGANERVEIRKTVNGTQMLIIVYKERRDGADHHENVQISANGKIQLSFAEWQEMTQAIEEAKEILFPKEKMSREQLLSAVDKIVEEFAADYEEMAK